jgi:Double-GTPase 1
MISTDVLVLGASGTGKTHYAGQLLGRLKNDRQGRLKLRPGGVDNISRLDEVLACLEEGRAAGHTPAETWSGTRCELETADGSNILLEWPEYAGERLFSIIERRILPMEWRTSSKAATGWILFIRLSSLKLYEDLLDRPTGLVSKHTRSDSAPDGVIDWDDQARYVELLQMLIFAIGQSNFQRVLSPRLAIVLSCWDELESDDDTPEKIFADRLPMLETFIRSHWQESAWSVWGLSSLGRSLSQDIRDNEFAEKGPEHFGYVIPPGSSMQNGDLTAPVAWLLEV